MKNFTEEQIERYSRHILLPEFGGEGQRRLLEGSVFVVGAGGLGSAALLYLAAAGVGKIGIADGDCVDLSNLQRQIIHGTADIGKPKVESAAEALNAINPDCHIETSKERLAVGNISRLLRDYDVIVDGSDNFPTRYLVADYCWLESIPLVSAAVLRFEGQLMTILPRGENPCYRCLFPEPPPAGVVPSCQEAGILGAVVGVMGILQAIEAIKILAGIGEPMVKQLLLYDALSGSWRTVRRAVNPDCPLCGKHPTITSLIEYQHSCNSVSEATGNENRR